MEWHSCSTSMFLHSFRMTWYFRCALRLLYNRLSLHADIIVQPVWKASPASKRVRYFLKPPSHAHQHTRLLIDPYHVCTYALPHNQLLSFLFLSSLVTLRVWIFFAGSDAGGAGSLPGLQVRERVTRRTGVVTRCRLPGGIEVVGSGFGGVSGSALRFPNALKTMPSRRSEADKVDMTSLSREVFRVAMGETVESMLEPFSSSTCEGNDASTRRIAYVPASVQRSGRLFRLLRTGSSDEPVSLVVPWRDTVK